VSSLLDGSPEFWLNELRWLSSLHADFPVLREHAIRRARAAGVNDTEIAKALGISRQAVAQAVPRG
jgi:DNA-directed RNA polymerase specialized sigma24 family protein